MLPNGRHVVNNPTELLFETRLIGKLTRFSLILLGLALACFALLSLQWRFQHDTALLFYISFLIEHFGYVPYRDIFDVNLPVTYGIYGLIGRLTGYSDIGIRIADLTLLGGLMWMTWRWLKGFGAQSAWAGAIVFGLVYLRLGPAVSLQREFLILLPVVGGILVFTQMKRFGFALRAGLTGFMFGFAVLIKPQAGIAFPILLVYDLIERRSRVRPILLQTIVPALGGFLLPLLIVFMYLLRHDALEPLRSIIRDYYPLYGQLTGDQSTISQHERLGYLLSGYFQFGGFGWWWIPALLGLHTALRAKPGSEQRRQIILLLTLAVSYSFYPLFSGKFWHYHWMLFAYFSVQLGSLCFVPQPDQIPLFRRLAPTAVFLCFAFYFVAPTAIMLDQIRTHEAASIKGGRVDEIAEYLRPRMRPGDSVQPLDWTGGAAHALLLAGARPATRFVYDVMFYHHGSGDYTQGLRREFAEQLKLTRPRFVIEVFGEDKPWVHGEDTTREFGELREFVDGTYEMVLEGNG